jgi:hypothetical protein
MLPPYSSMRQPQRKAIIGPASHPYLLGAAGEQEEIQNSLSTRKLALSYDVSLHIHGHAGSLECWAGPSIRTVGNASTAISTMQLILYFLKGGRALNYFLGTPEKGENDWDTQVVIDPSLPPEEWYQAFTKIHAVLLA